MAGKKKQDGASKKATQKKKAQIVEDKTFGLKNKKKSKVVQSQIRSIEKGVMNSGSLQERKLNEKRKMEKSAQKARKKAEKNERDTLFGEALLAVSKKTTTRTKGIVEAKGRDGDDEKQKSGTSRAMKMMFQMDAKEMDQKLMEDPNYVRTIEDEIEAQRQSMMEKCKKRTPITESSFNAWLEAKRKRKMDAVKKLLNIELRKKKGGKGLSVLSGRELYNYNKKLFVDQDTEHDDQDNNQNQEPKVEADLETVTNAIQQDLFLEGDDDDLDDIDDDDLDDIND